MKGQAHWIDLIVILAGALLVFGGIFLATARWTIKRIRMRLTCPVDSARVDVVMTQDAATGVYVDVESCSAFKNPRQVRCQEDCRRKLNLEGEGRLHLVQRPSA
jgi:hypothetical protein